VKYVQKLVDFETNKIKLRFGIQNVKVKDARNKKRKYLAHVLI
jgi:hypothetical protein